MTKPQQQTTISVLIIVAAVFISYLIISTPQEAQDTEKLSPMNKADMENEVEVLTRNLLPESTLPTKDWKTYTNKAWGIEFKYPSDLIIEDVSHKTGDGDQYLTAYFSGGICVDFAVAMHVWKEYPERISGKYLLRDDVNNYYFDFVGEEEIVLAMASSLNTFEPEGLGVWNEGSDINTNGWKRYVNSEFGFAISHPPNWVPGAFGEIEDWSLIFGFETLEGEYVPIRLDISRERRYLPEARSNYGVIKKAVSSGNSLAVSYWAKFASDRGSINRYDFTSGTSCGHEYTEEERNVITAVVGSLKLFPVGWEPRTAVFTGYYEPYDKLNDMDTVDGVSTCEALHVLEEEGELYEEFLDNIAHGNLVNVLSSGGELLLNLDLQRLPSKMAEHIKSSSPSNSVRITVEEGYPRGTFGGACFSFVDVLSVE